MIKIYDFLWKRLADYGKKFQSGMDVVDDFNTKIDEVQLEVINDLSPYYQANELVRGMINAWVRRIVSVSNASGIINRPTVSGEEFMRVLSLGVVDDAGSYRFEINPYLENEITIAQRLPQRKPSIAKRIVCYVPFDNSIQLYPEEAINYAMYYLIYPKQAKIAFTYTSTADEDVMTYDQANSVDLVWDKNASNIILYKLLEKYGISSREMLLAEYAKLGIQTSLGGQE